MDKKPFCPTSDEALRKAISKRIANYRRLSGLTQTQLSKNSGVSVASIQRIEQGHDEVLPGVPTLLRLMNAFERDISELFC